MARFANSRFNPAPGALDFWNEFRKPNPYRVPLLIAAAVPFALIFYALGSETYYVAPERPTIDYITTLDPDRSDAEIIDSNIANQEVKDLREERDAGLAQRKRDLYKALGAAAGMDVEEIERRADEERAIEEAAEAAEREEMFGAGANEPPPIDESSAQ
jgi:hypothetical protein